jgi:STE24 endopeptidase
MFFGVLGLGSFIIGIPFSYYSVFTIEEKFGFNKMNLKTFITDKIKGILLSIVIGGSLLTAFIYFYQAFPEDFWLYGWIVFTAFSLLMAAFYVDLIVPIFNKLSPLDDKELFEKIKKLARSTNFPLSNISVIDGSKRSSKANAYFSGIGFKKSIVLFDTLIEEHSHEELLAILAHEIGHYKKKHILWSFGLSAINMLITLFILAWFIKTPELSQALGAPEVNFAIGLIAFSLIYSPISTLTSIAMNMLSRRFEYQADAYAKKHSSANDLISSLKRLSVKHLSNLKPHPSYVFVHYSHPTLLQRIKALTKDNN